MSEQAVRLKAVSKAFGKVEALKQVDLSVPKGAIYCLLGVNGAGKSTALRVLLNRMKADEGSVEALGESASDLRADDFQRIGYVSEGQKLYDWLSLEQTIRLAKRLYPKWDDEYCERLNGMFGLPYDRKLRTMSRGMKMKAKMLLALSFHPELVVMDEPFSGLDPIVRQDCIEALIDWVQEGERTLIISSHDIDDVEPICDHVGILHEGKVILEESLEQLKARTRKVSFHSRVEQFPESVNESWIRFRKNQRHCEMLDCSFDSKTSLERLTAAFPGAENVQFVPLSLKELFVAKVKHETEKSKGREV